MKKFTRTSLFILLSVASQIFSLDTADQKSINQIIENISLSWNSQAGHGFADHYAADADFVNIFGMTFSGKDEIEARHVKILETFLKGSIMDVDSIKLREAQPGTVIALVNWKVSNIQKPGKDSLYETMQGVFTHVFLKNNGKWEIAASQNTTIAKPTP